MSIGITTGRRTLQHEFGVGGESCSLTDLHSVSGYPGFTLVVDAETPTPLNIVNKQDDVVLIGQDADTVEGACGAVFGNPGLTSNFSLIVNGLAGTTGQLLTSNGDGSCGWAAPAFLARIEALEKKAGITPPVAEEVKPPVTARQVMGKFKIRKPVVVPSNNYARAVDPAPAIAVPNRTVKHPVRFGQVKKV
jgi:hypothetical protein